MVRTKDQTLKEHQYNTEYYAEFLENNCSENYTGEVRRRLIELVVDHNRRGTRLKVFQHAVKKEHRPPIVDDF